MESFRVRKSSWFLLCVESHCTSSFPTSTLSRRFPGLSRKQTPPLIWLAETAEGDVLNTMIKKKNPELSHSPLCALTGIGRRVGSANNDVRAAGIRASLLRAVNEHSEEIKMKGGGRLRAPSLQRSGVFNWLSHFHKGEINKEIRKHFNGIPGRLV